MAGMDVLYVVNPNFPFQKTVDETLTYEIISAVLERILTISLGHCDNVLQNILSEGRPGY